MKAKQSILCYGVDAQKRVSRSENKLKACATVSIIEWNTGAAGTNVFKK